MEVIKLTKEEKDSLKNQHKSERDRRIADRIKAVLLYDQGYSYEKIAEILLLSHEGVRKHVRDYWDFRKLETNNGGRVSKLSDSQLKELEIHLEENNYVYAKDIAGYIWDKYGVSYTIAGVTKLLYKLGFTYKKPKLIPGKLNSEKQEEWKLQYSLLKENLKENEAIYFMDSVHPQYQTRAKCGWIKKNVTKTLPTFSGWKRKHIIGAIELSGLKFINTDNPKVDGERIIEFFKKLEAQNPDKEKIYLICDNAGYHKSKKVKEYIAKTKIELIFLPPYSPNLNPIERLWKFMHKIVTNNKYYANFEQFTESINMFFNKMNMEKYKNSLSTLVNDNFQTIEVNHFNSSS